MLTLRRRPGEVLYIGDVSLKNVNGRSVLLVIPGHGECVLQLHLADNRHYVLAKRHGEEIHVGDATVYRIEEWLKQAPILVDIPGRFRFRLRLKRHEGGILIVSIEAPKDVIIRRKELVTGNKVRTWKDTKSS